MSNGTHAHMNIPAVKAACNDLECSPSKNSASSPIAHGGTRAVGHGVTEKTSKLKHGTTRPKPHGTHVEGKKDMMSHKSRGR